MGLFTSPHLYSIAERIRIVTTGTEGQVTFNSISAEDLTAAEDAVWPHVEAHNAAAADFGLIGFFECMTLLAFHYFAQEGVDAVVVEVGTLLTLSKSAF